MNTVSTPFSQEIARMIINEINASINVRCCREKTIFTFTTPFFEKNLFKLCGDSYSFYIFKNENTLVLSYGCLRNTYALINNTSNIILENGDVIKLQFEGHLNKSAKYYFYIYNDYFKIKYKKEHKHPSSHKIGSFYVPIKKTEQMMNDFINTCKGVLKMKT